MEILPYTEKHKKFRQRVRSFMEKEVIPFTDQWETDRIMPRSAWKRMGEEGFLCTTISPEYGGPGADFLHAVIFAEEIARTNQTGQGPPTHSDIVVPYIDSFASEELKRKYLPGCVSGDIITAIAMTEPDTGSDLSGITTTAVEFGDEVIINGAKIFITNGINCDLVVLAAKNPSIENPYEAMSLYLVEAGAPGFKKGRKLDKMGMHSQDTAELFFSDCRIPKKNRLGQKGKGFFMLMQELQQERLMLTIYSITAAEYVLEQTIDYYKTNSGSDKQIPESQALQFALVEMATEVRIGRTFLDKLIADHIDRKDVIIETSMAKYWITEMARRIADRGLDIYGNFAAVETCPIVRYWRDVRAMSIVGGTNEIMRNIIAKYMKV